MRYTDNEILGFVWMYYDSESLIQELNLSEKDVVLRFKEDILEINRDKFEQAFREFRVNSGYEEPEEITQKDLEGLFV